MKRLSLVLSVLSFVSGAVPLVGRAMASTVADRVEPGVLAATGPQDVIVRFRERVPAGLARIGGLDVRYRFTSIPAVHARASVAAVRALAARDDLAYLERDKPIEFDLNTATIASRARDVFDPTFDASTPPVLDASGDPIDGAGVGIAIVDTGLDGTHPDFQAPGKVGGNWIVTPGGLVPSTYSAGTQGHGTHVAGIAAGNGAASAGAYRGAAPGATVYAFGMGASTVIFPSIAFDWILTNGAAQHPPIRIVNNSWHCADIAACTVFNPDLIHVRLASRLAEAGILVTWSAGNDGGDGYIATTNIESRNPTPGVISVGNYNDADSGTRGGCIYGREGGEGTSSRGSALDPSTWPDLIAPGGAVMSTWATTYDLGDSTTEQKPRVPAAGPYAGTGTYRALSGTSMAAPHLAGVAALMVQANPSLQPADIEYIMKATASKLSCGTEYARADAAHPFDGANFVEGHGLVDALAAVEAARGFTSIPPAPEVEPLPESFLRVRVGVTDEADLFVHDGSLRADTPAGDQPTVTVIQQNTPTSFTSEPFAARADVGGVRVSLWTGTTGESAFGSLNGAFRLISTVSRVDTNGVASTIARTDARLRRTPTGSPAHRAWVLPLDEPVLLEAGDRLRLTLELSTVGSNTLIPEIALLLYSDSAATPSKVALGSALWPVFPESDAGCDVRHDCARIGNGVELSSFYCDDSSPIRVRWRGPPGSVAWASCWDQVATCAVPGEPGDPWGECEGTAVRSSFDAGYDTTCGYRSVHGEPGGYGRCESARPLTTGTGS